MLDAHNHLQKFPNPDRIITEMKAAGITGCIVNGTSESDWPEVAALADAHPGFVHPAFGLHPWFAHQRSSTWLDTLQALLDRYPHASIGECGLDRWIDHPTTTEQFDVFLPQVRLARERQLPLTIHALKAWGPLLEALQQEPPPKRGFLMHSFGGSRELIDRLLPLGARFSFSGYFLQPKKSKVLETFKHVPPDRLLLETDAPDMLPPEESITHPLSEARNHPANLPAIGQSLASHLKQDPEKLIHQCSENTQHLLLFT
ncbi:TatD family hydrolase [Haloferula rosea]|uniref:TatD family hydrolase n=1 Tax=Haloferula rosea TaxID=490093 RepID=A0A934R9S6_9BACT|nr:TatD family hydrolase [Haloferula rosea]MBK1825823.1 TatD family hydrolase [Haloferula rosea]